MSIAEKPELLEALRSALSQIRTLSHDHPDDAINNAILALGDAAIAKSENEQVANARLITAAPELLEALRRLSDDADFADLHVLQNSHKGIRLLKQVILARAAIAKAEGRE